MTLRSTRHCERRSRAAIQSGVNRPGLLRSARNDEVGQSRVVMFQSWASETAFCAGTHRLMGRS
ncbi:hypothetical protein C3E99_18190 [Sphingopyxis sp. MG]|nr:hypothetical protein C3E99_18190 [Sphingopyxis sp. MG]